MTFTAEYYKLMEREHDSQCPSQESNQASPKYNKHYCLKKLSHKQFGKQLKMVTVSSISAVNFQLSFMK
jgi:hypothetical protein